jgi:predicted AAA+ superfamily ATPase
MDDLLPRLSERRLAELMTAFRVVVVNGPRQAGKTTLMHIYRDHHSGEFVSLDDPVQLTAALNDPQSLIEFGARPLLIDEVQRGGDPLVLSIKRAVDQDRSRGQFMLSGSAQFLTVPKLLDPQTAEPLGSTCGEHLRDLRPRPQHRTDQGHRP